MRMIKRWNGNDDASNSQDPPLVVESEVLPFEDLVSKKKAYYLLSSLLAKRDQILSNLGLPSYEVPWLRVPETTSSNGNAADVDDQAGVADEPQGYQRSRGRRRVPLVTKP